jgi:transposase
MVNNWPQKKKTIIFRLSNKGFSNRKIADITGKNRRTISKILQRNRERHSLENLPRSGRPPKTGQRDDRALHRLLLADRRQTLCELTTNFNRYGTSQISSRTVRRRLKFEGYDRHPVSKRIVISPVNREKRKRFCRSRLHWKVQEHWNKVIYSDETRIEIGNNQKWYVWRKSNERLRPECNWLYRGKNYRAKFSVMFWGCITYYGVGTLTAVDGNMNSDKYINILDNNLWPVIARHFPATDFIFQEDNAPCHVSRQSNQWKSDNNIRTLDWPPQSPDLNIIENIWKVIKVRVRRRICKIENASDLRTVVAEIWSSLQAHYVRSLYNSIPRRIRAVLETRGNITKY